MRSSRSDTRYGLLIDVGSGSVGFALVQSQNKADAPTILWQTREYVKIPAKSSVSNTSKALISILTDASLSVATTIPKILQEHTNAKSPKLDSIQVTVAAPFAYTVSRTINYKQDEPFPITDQLVHDLTVAADEDAVRTFDESHNQKIKELAQTSHTVLELSANGYVLPAVNSQPTTSLSSVHGTTLMHKVLHDALVELGQKLFPDVPLQITSAMMAMFYIVKMAKPLEKNMGLVILTAEATELGIVRNNTLTYCTYTDTGTFGLARQFSDKKKRDLTETHANLHENIILDAAQDGDLVSKYRDSLTQLFNETGDGLSVPRSTYVLANPKISEAMAPIITSITTQVCATQAKVTPIIGLETSNSDRALDQGMTIASRFFHTMSDRPHFEFV